MIDDDSVDCTGVDLLSHCCCCDVLVAATRMMKEKTRSNRRSVGFVRDEFADTVDAPIRLVDVRG